MTDQVSNLLSSTEASLRKIQEEMGRRAKAVERQVKEAEKQRRKEERAFEAALRKRIDTAISAIMNLAAVGEMPEFQSLMRVSRSKGITLWGGTETTSVGGDMNVTWFTESYIRMMPDALHLYVHVDGNKRKWTDSSWNCSTKIPYTLKDHGELRTLLAPIATIKLPYGYAYDAYKYEGFGLRTEFLFEELVKLADEKYRESKFAVSTKALLNPQDN